MFVLSASLLDCCSNCINRRDVTDLIPYSRKNAKQSGHISRNVTAGTKLAMLRIRGTEKL
jgi:hypothetical protein